jgi:hypothetical protein
MHTGHGFSCKSTCLAARSHTRACGPTWQKGRYRSETQSVSRLVDADDTLQSLAHFAHCSPPRDHERYLPYLVFCTCTLRYPQLAYDTIRECGGPRGNDTHVAFRTHTRQASALLLLRTIRSTPPPSSFALESLAACCTSSSASTPAARSTMTYSCGCLAARWLTPPCRR